MESIVRSACSPAQAGAQTSAKSLFVWDWTPACAGEHGQFVIRSILTHPHQTRLRKIIADIEQRTTILLRHFIGKAVAEIERGGVSAFALYLKSSPRRGELMLAMLDLIRQRSA